MSSFLCFVCHSTVNADTNEDTRDKYREVIGMNLCPDSHLCFICCHFLNKMWLFKSICLKRSLEYPVLFSEKGTINLQRCDTQVGILCPEDICLQHRNTKYHFYNSENSPLEFEENKYVQLHEDMHFGLLPNNVEVQTDDIFDHFNDNLLKSDADVHFNNEFLVSISKETNEVNARRDIDEFIFGNDSIESPLENINKIELANLDEMTEVNITLTDLNVRNFEKLQENNEKSYMDKTYFRNDFVGKAEEYPREQCSRNISFEDKSHEHVKNNEYIERPDEYCMRNDFADKTDVANNEVVINSLQKSPELVRNSDFIEKPQEYVVRNNDFIDNSTEENDFGQNQETDDDYDTKNAMDVPNDDENEPFNDQYSDSPSLGDIEETNEKEAEKQVKTKKDKVKKSKNIFKLITLTPEEQKQELEANRRDKKYTEAVFKCYSCGTGFMFKDSYQAHMMRHEESNGEHRCSICTLRFANRAVLRSHRANHAVRYQCRQCEQIVRRRHKSTHACQRAKLTPVPCHLCDSVFPSPSHHQQHLKRVHNKSRRAYLCNICGKSYTNQAAVRTHMITHINKKFPCEQCSSTFSSPYTLNQHKKKHQSHSSELHYCVTCNIGYKSRKSLLAHQRNALAHMENVYKCPVCDKTCPTLRALHNHTTAVHARTKDLFCAMCPARYSTRKGLVRHMRCHSDAGPRLLPLCHACGQTFKSSSILKRHLKNVCEKDKLEEELSTYYER